MRALLLTIGVLVVAYFVQGSSPWLAGAIAVIPVKIIAVAFMTWERNPKALHDAIEGMLVWQCVWAVVLLVVWRITKS